MTNNIIDCAARAGARHLSSLSTFIVGAYCAVLTAASILPIPAEASEFSLLSLEEMVKESGAIVRARAAAIDPTEYNAETRECFTRVDFEIEEVLLGNLEESKISFWLRGGLRPNGMLNENTLTTNFVVGEVSLLFITDGSYVVTPFVHGYAFREVMFDGQLVFADHEGHLVELEASGPREDSRRTADARSLRTGILSDFRVTTVVQAIDTRVRKAARLRGEPAPNAQISESDVSRPVQAGPLPTAETSLRRLKETIESVSQKNPRIRRTIESRPRPFSDIR